MLGVVIASILAVASVTATAAVAGLALHQGIQTADFIRDWHKDSHLLWQQQREWMPNLLLTCSIFNTPYPDLKSIGCFIYMKCDWNSSQFCIAPVPLNMSEGCEKVK